MLFRFYTCFKIYGQSAVRLLKFKHATLYCVHIIINQSMHKAWVDQVDPNNVPIIGNNRLIN